MISKQIKKKHSSIIIPIIGAYGIGNGKVIELTPYELSLLLLS